MFRGDFLLKTIISNICIHVNLLQSCPTLGDPMDCSPPGPSVHGILQARVLEWVVMPSFGGSYQPRDRNCISVTPAFLADSLSLSHQGSPFSIHIIFSQISFTCLIFISIISIILV